MNKQCLKQDDMTPDELMDAFDFELADDCSYIVTFKVFQKTSFDEIKMAACKFWGFENFPEQWIVTDEYFNNLSTYKDTVQMFFTKQNGYQPLNPNLEASVFFLRKNTRREGLHPQQLESIEIQDENNKKDEAPVGGVGSSDEEAGTNKPKKVKIEMIANTIVGLKTYEVRINDKKMDTYIKWTESHEDPLLNIWQFIISMTLLMMNQYGKKLKNDYKEEYAVRKIVESFF